MAFVLKDRVKDSTATTGTGTITLAGTPPTGFQAFSAVGNGNTTYYTISGGAEWEVGIGTYSTTGPTLARTTVLASSNAGALVSFSAGTKDVYSALPGQALLDKADLASPTFTGVPAAPTAAAATNTTQLATSAFVQQELAITSGVTTPTLTAFSGTITTKSCRMEWERRGKEITVHGSATVTTNGTGGSFLATNLPVATRTGVMKFVGCGYNDSTLAVVGCSATAGTTNLAIFSATGGYPIASGQTVYFQITYMVD